MGTKGTWRRPAAVSDAEMDRRWGAVFAKPGYAVSEPVDPEALRLPAQIDAPADNR